MCGFWCSALDDWGALRRRRSGWRYGTAKLLFGGRNHDDRRVGLRVVQVWPSVNAPKQWPVWFAADSRVFTGLLKEAKVLPCPQAFLAFQPLR